MLLKLDLILMEYGLGKFSYLKKKGLIYIFLKKVLKSVKN